MTPRWQNRSQVRCSGVDVEGDAPDVDVDGSIDVPDVARVDCPKAMVGTIRWTCGRQECGVAEASAFVPDLFDADVRLTRARRDADVWPMVARR